MADVGARRTVPETLNLEFLNFEFSRSEQMKLKDVLTKVGSVVLKNVIPGAGIVIDAVNEFLPEDKKLDLDAATGNDAITAINSLPAETQAQIYTKEFDVEIEDIRGFTERFKAAADADKTGNSTRPAIALMMAKTVCFAIIVFISIWAYAIANGLSEVIKNLADSWVLMGTILSVPATLLYAYFGYRTKEKQSRYQLAGDQQIGTGVIGSIIKAIKK